MTTYRIRTDYFTPAKRHATDIREVTADSLQRAMEIAARAVLREGRTIVGQEAEPEDADDA